MGGLSSQSEKGGSQNQIETERKRKPERETWREDKLRRERRGKERREKESQSEKQGLGENPREEREEKTIGGRKGKREKQIQFREIIRVIRNSNY